MEDSASRRSNKVVGLTHGSSVSRLEVQLTRLDPTSDVHHFLSGPDTQPRPYQHWIAILGRPGSLHARIVCPKSPIKKRREEDGLTLS